MKTVSLLAIVLLAFATAFSYANRDGFSVGSIKTKGFIVDLWNVDGRSMYLVKNAHGEVLSDKLSAEELTNIYPGLGELVEAGVVYDASLGPNINRHSPPGVIVVD